MVRWHFMFTWKPFFFRAWQSFLTTIRSLSLKCHQFPWKRLYLMPQKRLVKAGKNWKWWLMFFIIPLHYFIILGTGTVKEVFSLSLKVSSGCSRGKDYPGFLACFITSCLLVCFLPNSFLPFFLYLLSITIWEHVFPCFQLFYLTGKIYLINI